nr:hypothetical protein [uncultured Psychroserpens sp.]
MRPKILIIILCITSNFYAQEKDFYVTDNSYHNLYKTNNVKTITTYNTNTLSDYSDERVLESVVQIDREGNIIKEVEYGENGEIDIEISHTYNNNHQIQQTDWLWHDDNSLDITTYTYSKNGRLKKSCDYYKKINTQNFVLENCDSYSYKKNSIDKVKSSKNNTITYYFKKNDSIISKYNSENKFVSNYINGNIVLLHLNNSISTFYRNSLNQTTKIITRDIEGYLVETYEFEYNVGLLNKILKMNNVGAVHEISKIEYEYYH